MLAEDGEEKMCTRSCREENLKTSYRRMCRDPQGMHPNGGDCIRKNKRENEGMAERD